MSAVKMVDLTVEMIVASKAAMKADLTAVKMVDLTVEMMVASKDAMNSQL